MRASAAPATVLKGAPLTVSGTVTVVAAGTRVQIQVRGAKGWVTVTVAPTARTGAFSATIRAGRPGGARYRAVVAAAVRRPVAVSAVLPIRVVTTAFTVRAVRAGHARVLPGDRVTLTGVVRPVVAGPVTLQRLDPGSHGWVAAGTSRLGAAARFTVTGLAPNAGVVRFRVVRAFTATVAAGASAPLTVGVAAAGHRIVGKPGTVTAPTRQVVVVRPSGARRVVTLRPGTVAPKVGGHLVLASAPGAPHGLIGTVTAVARNAQGAAVVTTTPAALNQVFSDFAVAADLNLLTAPHAASAAAGGHAADYTIDPKDLTCDHHQHLDATVSVGITSATAAVTVNLRSQSISAILTIVPAITSTVKGDAKVSCSWDGPTLLTLPVPGAPYILVQLSPSASFDASGTFTLTGRIAVTMKAGFIYSSGSIRPVTSLTPTATTTFNGHAEAHAYLEDHVKISVGGRVGVDLAAGPGDNLVANADSTDPAKTCVEHYADMEASASVYIDVFLYHKSKTLAEGHFGHHTWYYACQAPPPVLNPALTVDPATVDAVNTSWCGTTFHDNGYAFVDWNVTGFAPGELLTMALPDENFGTVGSVASDGTASGYFELGEHLTGDYPLIATGSSGNQASFEVSIGSSACPRGNDNGDGTYSFTHWAGAGADPGAEADFYIDGSYINSTTVDGSGSYDQALDGGPDVTATCTADTPISWEVDTYADGLPAQYGYDIYCPNSSVHSRRAAGGSPATASGHLVRHRPGRSRPDGTLG